MCDGEDVCSVNPTLFLNYRGDPLMFDVKPCKEKKQLRKMIESGSGVVVSTPGPYSVSFVSDSVVYGGDDEVFSVKYIYDCCTFGEQLDLKKYKVNKGSRFGSDFDIMDVFVRNITWARAREKWGKTVRRPSSPDSVTGSGKRNPYTMKEKRMIVDFIVENNGFSGVKGNLLWQDMSVKLAKKGCVRTWQSLKEHFRKQIAPHIDTYKLAREHMKQFKACIEKR